MEVNQLNSDQLYGIAQDLDIPGRAGLKKAELIAEVRSRIGDDPFAQVDEVNEGDEVEMNHLNGSLFVTDVLNEDHYTAVVMETTRGGRHKLVARKDSPIGKNGELPHLERWRAGDKEWMNNSRDPTYFLIVSTAEDVEEEEVDPAEE